MSAQLSYEPWEDEVICELYATGGSNAVLKRLPHRNKASVQARASRLGIKLSPEFHALVRKNRNCKASIVNLTDAQLAAACLEIRKTWYTDPKMIEQVANAGE